MMRILYLNIEWKSDLYTSIAIRFMDIQRHRYATIVHVHTHTYIYHSPVTSINGGINSEVKVIKIDHWGGS